MCLLKHVLGILTIVLNFWLMHLVGPLELHLKYGEWASLVSNPSLSLHVSTTILWNKQLVTRRVLLQHQLSVINIFQLGSIRLLRRRGTHHVVSLRRRPIILRD
jgi:hypothetical protein